MVNSSVNQIRGPKAQPVRAMAGQRRRRGSVLILVMTLLGILFVTGVAFMATMSFEADMVDVQRRRDRHTASVDAVFEQASLRLREGLVGGPGLPFGGKLDEPFDLSNALAPIATGELPGVHNFFAPLEPYVDPGDRQLKFRTFTDLFGLVNGRGSWPHGNRWISPLWSSGVELPDPDDWFSEPIDTNGDGISDRPRFPVDSDGDGITDTVQFSLTKDLGFSKAQLRPLSRAVNGPGGADGEVFLGMRVIAHGGMVNLNDSHPNLIANALDVRNPRSGVLDLTRLFDCGSRDLDSYFFFFRPACNGSPSPPYSPLTDEAALRRRLLLPPRTMPPSYLHGNPLLDPVASALGRYGGGDMPALLYPPWAANPDGAEFETVFEGRHEYRPFSIDDPVHGIQQWVERMEPFSSLAADPAGRAYDRRHLVTTVSHDDLLARGGRHVQFGLPGIAVSRDLLELMREANRTANAASVCPGAGVAAAPLPFEYADYPQDIANNGCSCPTDWRCRFDDRKGRLKLSLPFLDAQFPCESLLTDPSAQSECFARREHLIHDVFMMLVRNARGAYWDEIDCSATGTNGVCPAGETCDLGDNLCHDIVTGLSHWENLISITAASLTANMIDFMDADDVPTRVARRLFDFDQPQCVGGVDDGRQCTTNADCSSGLCRNFVGRDFGGPELGGAPLNVYGLERQPYITEVATVANGTPPIERAIELFNPYDTDIRFVPGIDEYSLIEVDPATGLPGNEIPLREVFRAGQFLVVASPGIAPSVKVVSGVNQLVPETRLKFENGWTIYLVRRVRVRPEDTALTTIVIDQFNLDGGEIALPNPPSAPTFPWMFTRQRSATQASPWKAPVPVGLEAEFGADADAEPPPHTLGNFKPVDDATIRPVEVNFANADRFARDPNNLSTTAAFPTTGSLLLLMRHANRDLNDFQIATRRGGLAENRDLAFTTRLAPVPTAWTETDPSGVPTQVSVREQTQIDNGRMPVFDMGEDVPMVGRRYAHHIDPALGACCLAGGSCADGYSAECAAAGGRFVLGTHCSSNACQATSSPPGSLENLPWGQLVFDYFTALPLSSPGPYSGDIDPDFIPAAAAVPRVDQRGLRVHGRVNVNAAPWKVMAGLPLIPIEKIPAAFRAKVRWGAGLVDPGAADPLAPQAGELFVQDSAASPIGSALAQAIVAYRESRQILVFDPTTGATLTTGDYDNVAGGRGWLNTAPGSRRGGGFLSVGELANVRHAAASPDADPMNPQLEPNRVSYYRIDGRDLDWDSPDYVKAVGLLVALGDWVTVRSHVFTMYGTLRGEVDPDIVGSGTLAEWKSAATDVDSRALRFQETVDRLPMFLGRASPARIGRRVVVPYTDVRND